MREIANITRAEIEIEILKGTQAVKNFKELMGELKNRDNVVEGAKTFNAILEKNVADLEVKMEKFSKLEQGAQSEILKILKES